jgi:hypothetical protein
VGSDCVDPGSATAGRALEIEGESQHIQIGWGMRGETRDSQIELEMIGDALDSQVEQEMADESQ